MKKNFNSNIEKQFNNFQLKLPNHPTNLHYLYADYAELLTLISKTNITPNEVLDRLKDDGASINEDIGDIQNNLTDIIRNNSNIPNIMIIKKDGWMKFLKLLMIDLLCMAIPILLIIPKKRDSI